MNVRREEFSIPPKSDRGDVDRDAIHLAAGQALNNWERVEYFFGELYAAVLGAVVPVGALRAFGSVSAFLSAPAGERGLSVQKPETTEL
jgi:hypothetical protein